MMNSMCISVRRMRPRIPRRGLIPAVILASCLVPAALPAQSDESSVLIVQANAAYQAKDYAKAAQLFESAAAAGANGPTVAYCAACCHELVGHADSAFAWIDRAIQAGWRDPDRMKTDFASLHADPRWAPALRRCEEQRAQFVKSLKAPDLRDELLKRMQEDQRIRLQVKPGIMDLKTAAEWRKIDAENTAYMKGVIEKHGWPGKSLVAADGAQAAYLLVQHADADPAFQKKCLALLAKAVEQKEATAEHLAYLTDRVLVAEGKPQRYGTQFHTVNGELKPRPIEDEANVDARRKEVGLSTMAEYAKQMRELDKP